jgi:hypothetical protein
MDTKKSLSKNIATTFHLQQWLKENIPNGQSSIAISLFLLIAHKNIKGEALTLKHVFNGLGFSEQGVRPHLSIFLKHGYCHLKKSSTDGRVKHIVATPLMISRIKEMSDLIDRIVSLLK